MKDKFHGHYPPTPDETRDLWASCIFTFDASVLLNFYKYSETTRDSYLGILERLQDRIWIPYQAAKEYHRGRLRVITEEVKHYKDLGGKLEDIVNRLRSTKHHPFLGEETFTDFSQIAEKVQHELDEGKKTQRELLSIDPVLDKVSLLFAGRVGKLFDDAKLSEIYKDGEKRYKEKVPPGYEDADKPSEDAYGDLVIWCELIEESKTQKTPIAFVTDDTKGDWWLLHDGKPVGPRPELRQEFRAECGKFFFMYQSFSFMEHAETYLEEHVAKTAIEEIRDVQSQAVPRQRVLSEWAEIHNALATLYEQRVGEEAPSAYRPLVGRLRHLGYAADSEMWELVEELRSKYRGAKSSAGAQISHKFAEEYAAVAALARDAIRQAQTE